MKSRIEQVIDAGRQQQPVLPVDTLLVRRIPPGLAVAGHKVNRVLDSGDPAPLFDLHHPLFEQALPAPCPDDCLALGVLNRRVGGDAFFQPVLPNIEVVVGQHAVAGGDVRR